MNEYNAIGRLTKDPVISVTKVKKMKTATFTIAIDNYPKVEGQVTADFIRIVVYGKAAENCEKYIGKGSLVSVSGKLRSRNYTNKDGYTVFVTECVAKKVEFLDYTHKNKENSSDVPEPPADLDIPDGFAEVEDENEIPF